MHYLFFDTETGGFNAKQDSLLTAYFAVCDNRLVVIDELYLQLKPEDVSRIKASEGALKVNNINLSEHLADKATITYEEGAVKLLDLLKRNKLPRNKYSFRPCGHNIEFDRGFIWEQLLSKEEWSQHVHYNDLDTLDACTFLKDLSFLPSDVGNLTSLVEYFQLPLGEAHDARGDVLMNIEVYKSMKALMQSKKDSMSASMSSSLLEIIER